jgi:hypothetical protein
MPIAIAVDPWRRLRYSVATGVITDDDVAEAYARAMADPDADPSMNVLADLSGVERVDVSADCVRRLAARQVEDERGHTLRPRVAIVAPSDCAFGIARMYTAYRQSLDASSRLLVCRSREEAERWLELPEEPIEAR